MNSAKASREDAKRDVVPELIHQTKEMQDVYNKIDRIQELFNKMDQALAAINDRAGQVEKMLPTSSIASKLGSLFSSAFSSTTTIATAAIEPAINPLPLIPDPAEYFLPIPSEGYTGAIGTAPREVKGQNNSESLSTGGLSQPADSAANDEDGLP